MLNLPRIRSSPRFRKFTGFFLQSIMVTVAFMDSGNFVSNTKAGSMFKYKLLFVILASNFFAIIMQCLCVKLGSVTGLDLAQNCRKHFPRYINIILYIVAELVIITTDLAGVVGTAIALKILFRIPLPYGVLCTVIDVIVILLFYNPEKNVSQVRYFEIFIAILVASTMICFVFMLCSVSIPDKLNLFRGFLPSKTIFLDNEAVYLGCAIVGATVMPHSLYLGSALVQPRLQEFDLKHGLINFVDEEPHSVGQPPIVQAIDSGLFNKQIQSDLIKKHKPSLSSLRYSLSYSYFELIISLLIVASFVNSAILIVAGSALYGTPEADDADLISIYGLLSSYVSRPAGIIFVLSLLFSGQASGLVVTVAGQTVSEGFIHWKMLPAYRRLLTRIIAILPCFFVTIALGENGINSILNGSQVFLSLVLPICSAPLLFFTSNKRIMRVSKDSSSTMNSMLVRTSQNNNIAYGSISQTDSLSNKEDYEDFSNSYVLNLVAVVSWIMIIIFNFLNVLFIFEGLV